MSLQTRPGRYRKQKDNPPLVEEIEGVTVVAMLGRYLGAPGAGELALDAILYADSRESLLASFPAEGTDVENKLEKAELADALRRGLSALSAREAHIIQAYFGLDGQPPLTLEQIGATLGVTRERIRQLRNRALEKMRQYDGERLRAFSSV